MDGPISLEHAARIATRRNPYAVKDPTRQARTDLAQLMADGCPSIAHAARTMRITQSRCDQHWQAIKRGLGVEQCK